ncbi:MarR family winged helix-turn-helix transcriptional regulator [Virgibacillus siamensis]|uniref:MarR family winged helix-turn-helix transcriptional regulator n=1 Tax=Virgibacillus siamensis TaxID=480071 RepID=UPI0009865E14|nr:MarR family transcriptional regulator [Virgibacillus siamensis]
MRENLSLKAFVVLMKASKTVEEQIKKDIKSHGISTTEFSILEALYHKGKLTVNQICDAVLIKSGSMTYVVNKLYERGLLDRKPDHKDRRVIHVYLTSKGEKLMDEIFPKHQEVIEQIFDVINTKEKESMIRILKQVGLQQKEQ